MLTRPRLLTRRRLLTISAAMACLPAIARAKPATHLWTGRALGARASIRLDHPEGREIADRVLAEIDRLEDILSLYRADSALVRLNRDGHLDAPPFELLECLSIAEAVHRASDGRFDPSVQPLWAGWAEAVAEGQRPGARELEAVLADTGWQGVSMDAARIEMRPGMALTLNGIGQGYVADRVAAMLRNEGLTEILVDTGEFHAIGGDPEGGAWRAVLAAGGSVDLQDRALATSSPLGTTFDQEGQIGHILDPETGQPAGPVWQEISISAPNAALADALSTAACLMPDHEGIEAMLAHFPDSRLEGAAAGSGKKES